jgi:hypothetical protein
VVHWADGGETSLENTVLLCRYHHRLVHEEGWKIEWWGVGRPAFRDPRGSVQLAERKRPPPLTNDPVAALAEQNRLRGAEPDGWTAGPPALAGIGRPSSPTMYFSGPSKRPCRAGPEIQT